MAFVIKSIDYNMIKMLCSVKYEITVLSTIGSMKNMIIFTYLIIKLTSKYCHLINVYQWYSLTSLIKIPSVSNVFAMDDLVFSTNIKQCITDFTIYKFSKDLTRCA